MATSSTNLFSQVDKNHDGRIDQEEFQTWRTGEDKWRSSPYQSANDINYDRESAVITNSEEETDRYLSKTSHVFTTSNPRIIRRSGAANPLNYEQRISLRYLRPPTPPEPGPLIIKEVVPEQPPPPPPLVIRERGRDGSTPPPLVLRERPPQPPPRIPSETIVRKVPAEPLPPRSVIIERYTSAPNKPRDIVIERWLPYGPPRERRTVVERARSAIKYPEPTHTIILFDNVESRVNRKFENLGIAREDPETYMSRWGSALLDPDTLVNEARRAGVVEDISASPTSTVATIMPRGGYTSDYVGREPIREPYTSSDCDAPGFMSGYQVGDSSCTTSMRRKEGSSCDSEYTQYM